MIRLSKRLQAIADMISPCETIADVGCDHGFLSIYLIENNIAKKVYACDINEGPIKRARANIAEYNMEKCIEAIQCDGLLGIKNCDSIVIAGLGGKLMIKILQDSPSVVSSAKYLILEPQSENEYFRKSLKDMGYKIIDEDFVLDEGKFYPVIKVTAGKMNLNRMEALYGPILLKNRNPVLKNYLIKEREHLQRLLSEIGQNNTEKSRARVEEIHQELMLNEDALKEISADR